MIESPMVSGSSRLRNRVAWNPRTQPASICLCKTVQKASACFLIETDCHVEFSASGSVVARGVQDIWVSNVKLGRPPGLDRAGEVVPHDFGWLRGIIGGEVAACAVSQHDLSFLLTRQSKVLFPSLIRELQGLLYKSGGGTATVSR
eukprot:1309911-Amphidinium_carterae.1